MENEKDRSFEETNNETPGTTVLFEMEYENEEYRAKASGSGFFIESDKIVTNVHVLAGATKFTVRRVDTELFYTIEGVAAFDDKNDLVILKIAEENKPFSLGDSNTVRKKDKVYVIGYPDGKEISVERSVQGFQYSGKHIILDNKLSSGNSGGPVLNGKDEVIGIAKAVTEKFASNKNIQSKGIAISSNYLKLLLDEVRQVESIDVWQKRPHIQAYAIADEGNKRREEGKYEEAIEHYNTALNLNPHFIDIYQNRAVSKAALGRYKEAFADYHTMIKLRVKMGVILNYFSLLVLGFFYLKTYGMKILMKQLFSVIGKEKG